MTVDARHGFDIRQYTGSENCFVDQDNPQFYSKVIEGRTVKGGTWVVRYATGKQLCHGANFSPYTTMGKCQDIYRYNAMTGKNVGLELETETQLREAANVQALNAPQVGCIIGSDGKFYSNVADAKKANAGVDAVAFVACLNGKKRVEKGQDYNGLAICLKGMDNLKFQDVEIAHCGLQSVFLVNQLVNEKNGLANTRHLADECGQKHNHPAAKACDYTAFPGNNTFSKAFLPSTGQWILAMRGMGMAWDDELGFGNENNENRNQQREEQQIAHVKQMFENAGTELSTTRSYWTSTKYDGSYVNLFTIDYQVLMGRPMYGSADKTRNALPFIAFKYDGGATED